MDIIHHNRIVDNISWHWVEAGKGDCIVLLHGIPESWQCWHHQIEALSSQFRVIAIDLKGYGKSDKSDDNYTGQHVALQILALLDAIDVNKFRLAGHDWGVYISDHIVNTEPNRVKQYVRCCLSLHKYDPRNSLHHQWISNYPEEASRLMEKAEAYVRVWFESSCKEETIPNEHELNEIVKEFSYDGISTSVPKYFRDLKNTTPVDYSKFTMPILYIHGEHDPRQPLEYCRGMEEHLPGLEAILVLDSGHFITRERPDQVTRAMMLFFNRMLAPGTDLFRRSRELGLPTKPVKELKSWGLNSFKQ